MMLISGFYGPDIWQTPLVNPFPFLSAYLEPKTNIRDLWVPLILGTFCVAHLPSCVYNVWEARRAKNLPMLPLFLEWTPMIMFTGSCMAWLGSPHSHLLKENHLILFCLTMSLVFGRMTTKIILAHLPRQPFPYWTILLTPLVGGAILANFPVFGLEQVSHETELLFLRLYFVFAAIVYGRWAHLVISSICDYLGINCLTIPYENRQDNKVKAMGNGEAKSPPSENGTRIEKHD